MSNPKIEVYAAMLERAKLHTLSTANSVPETARLRQLAEGKGTPLWLLGHLANTINVVVRMWMFEEKSMLEADLSLTFAPDFAGGKPPTPNADDYPAWDDVLKLYEEVFNATLPMIRAMEDSQLTEPPKGEVPEPVRSFFSSNAATLDQMVSHDAHHRGQIALIANLP